MFSSRNKKDISNYWMKKSALSVAMTYVKPVFASFLKRVYSRRQGSTPKGGQIPAFKSSSFSEGVCFEGKHTGSHKKEIK